MNHWGRRYAGFIAAAGLLAAIVSAGLSYWAIRAGYDIARRSGAFEKSDPRLFFSQTELDLGQPTSIMYSLDFTKAPLAFCRLSLAVGNAGAKHLREVSLTVRAPSHLVIPTELLEANVVIRTPIERQPSRTVSSAGPFSYIVYVLPEVAPKALISIEDFVRCHETKFSSLLRLEQHAATVSYTLTYAYELLISVHAQDHPTVDHRLSVFGRQADPKESALIAGVQGAYNQALNRRKATTALAYFRGLLTGATERLFIVEPDITVLDADGKKLLVPAERSTVSTAVLPLFRLWLLFRIR
jgi:hypothetical protein